LITFQEERLKKVDLQSKLANSNSVELFFGGID
jgi:hypothetical protein